jgi:O-antigen ligase
MTTTLAFENTLRLRVADGVAIFTRLAFAMLIGLIPFRYRFIQIARPLPPIYNDYTDFILSASDIFLLATLCGWGITLMLHPRRINRGPLLLTLPLAGVTLMSAVSVPFSVDPALSLYHAIRILWLDALYLYVVNEVKSLRTLIVPVSLQVLIQASIGLMQFLHQHSLGLASLGELVLDPAWQGVSIVWSGTAILLRAYGLTDHPNILGGLLAFALVMLIFFYLATPSAWRNVITAIVALGIVTLFLTFSRAAWFAFGGGTALIALLLYRTQQREQLQNGFALLIATLIIVSPFVFQYANYLGVRLNLNEPSMNTGENRAIVEREALMNAGNDIFTQHAIVGAGLGTFPIALRAARPAFPFDYQPAHFVLLDVAAEIGIFGATFYLALIVAPFLALWFERRHLRANPASLAMIAVTGLLLTTLLVGWFDYYTWLLIPGRLWQWLTLGLWGTAYQTWKNTNG